MIKPLKMMIWNAQSVRPKSLEFFAVIQRLEILISLISETHLTSNDSLKDPRYRTYRLDRGDGRRGGGVAIVVRKGVPHRLLPCPRTRCMESLAIELFLSGRRLVIVSTYFPGSVDPIVLSNYRRDLELLSELGPNVLIGGDLNSRHSFWGCTGTNAAGTILFQEVIGGDMFLHFPDSPTHYPHSGRTPSTLDLILTKGFTSISGITVDPCLSSDHRPVLFELTDGVELADIPHQIVKDFSSADWRRYSSMINASLSDVDTNNINSVEKIDEVVSLLTGSIRSADRACIPRKRRQFGTFGLTPEVLTLIGERRSAIRRWQRTRDQAHRDLIRRLDLEIQNAMSTLVNKRFERSVLGLMNDPGPHRTKFWRLVRNLRRKPKAIPTMQTDDGPLVTPAEKCEAFANHFQNIPRVAPSRRTRALDASVKRCIDDIRATPLSTEDVPTITRRAVENEIRSLKNGKAPGRDDITAQHLKHIPANAILLIVALLNACLRLGYFPSSWKDAKVITICKPGKPPDLVSSYRFLSLLAILGKIFERIVLPLLRGHLEERSIIPHYQYGFQPGKSCTHQLLRVTQYVKTQLAQRKSVGMLCLDLSSAFDCVRHDLLLYKMSSVGLPLYLLRIMDSFLSGRKFRVAIGFTMSESKDMTVGVPQGSVLSPTLFNVYVYDVPVSEDIELAQFADDSAFLTSSHRTPTIVGRLQRTSTRVVRYFTSLGVRVNGAKSEATIFTRKVAERHRPTSVLSVDGTDVPWSDSVKYLGMILDKRLTYRHHVQHLIERSEKAMKCLYPLINRRSRVNVPNKLLLFNTMYRPTFTYGAPLIARSAATHRKRMQVHQNKILKLMLNKPRRFPTAALHDIARVDMIDDYLLRLRENFLTSCTNNIHEDVVHLATGLT